MTAADRARMALAAALTSREYTELSPTSPYQLRNAIVGMTLRYASSVRKAAYADAAGRVEQYERQRRATKRQFMAIQRLTSALERLARRRRSRGPAVTDPQTESYTDADIERVINAYHWAARNSCGPDNCPGAAVCVYAEHLSPEPFRAVLDALSAAGRLA